MDPYAERPTGRGSVEDSDEPSGRKLAEAEPLVKQQPWEAKKLNEEQLRNNPFVIPDEPFAPTSSCASADAKTLLLDGLLDKGSSIAEHAIVVNAHLGQGNVLLFGNNPIYRGETIGTYGPGLQRHPQPRPPRAQSRAGGKTLIAPSHADSEHGGFSQGGILCHAVTHGKQRQRQERNQEGA